MKYTQVGEKQAMMKGKTSNDERRQAIMKRIKEKKNGRYIEEKKLIVKKLETHVDNL